MRHLQLRSLLCCRCMLFRNMSCSMGCFARGAQALMTGRMPYHFGYYRNPSDEGGVPLEYKLLPQVLAASPAKYISHAVGKVRTCVRTLELRLSAVLP